MLNAIHINGEFPLIEAKLLKTWQTFCLKSPPLPEFEKKTLNERLSAINLYWNDFFRGNLVVYRGNCDGFALFGFGKKWLEASNEEKQKLPEDLAVLIMGATLNKNLSSSFGAIKLLKESFLLLKEKYGTPVVAWNINRRYKRKPFERIMSKVGKPRETFWLFE